jgi:hypothetical protein
MSVLVYLHYEWCRMLHSVMMQKVLYNNKVIRGIGPGVIEVDVGAFETYIRDVEYDLLKQVVNRYNIIIISFCCYGLSYPLS